MTTRTRCFAIASLLVLTVGLGTGLVAYYVGGFLPLVDGGTDELQFIPPNASLVAFAEVRQIISSPLRQRLQTLLPRGAINGEGQRDFQTLTGINIETDIDRVIAAFIDAPNHAGASESSPLVVARGRFDVVKIEALMREHGGRVEEYKGKRIVNGEQQGRPTLSVGFLEPGLLAVGTANLVRSAVDLASGGSNVTSNDELMSLVRALGSNNAWAVGRFEALASRARLPPGMSASLPAVSWFSVAATIDSGVSGVLRAEARDEQSANAFRDVVRGVMSLARLQGSSQPGLQQLLGSLQLGGTGKTVALSFDIPADVFDSLRPHTPR